MKTLLGVSLSIFVLLSIHMDASASLIPPPPPPPLPPASVQETHIHQHLINHQQALESHNRIHLEHINMTRRQHRKASMQEHRDGNGRILHNRRFIRRQKNERSTLFQWIRERRENRRNHDAATVN